VRTHDVRKNGCRARSLDVDVEQGVRERLEQLTEGGDLLPATDPRLADLAEGQVGDGAHPVGHPVEHAVVERQQRAVLRDVDVGLEVGVAELHRVPERGQGVLEPLDLGVVGATPVGEGQDPTVLQVQRAA
jgi:hypothetical protein